MSVVIPFLIDLYFLDDETVVIFPTNDPESLAFQNDPRIVEKIFGVNNIASKFSPTNILNQWYDSISFDGTVYMSGRTIPTKLSVSSYQERFLTSGTGVQASIFGHFYFAFVDNSPVLLCEDTQQERLLKSQVVKSPTLKNLIPCGIYCLKNRQKVIYLGQMDVTNSTIVKPHITISYPLLDDPFFSEYSTFRDKILDGTIKTRTDFLNFGTATYYSSPALRFRKTKPSFLAYEKTLDSTKLFLDLEEMYLRAWWSQFFWDVKYNYLPFLSRRNSLPSMSRSSCRLSIFDNLHQQFLQEATAVLNIVKTL